MVREEIFKNDAAEAGRGADLLAIPPPERGRFVLSAKVHLGLHPSARLVGPSERTSSKKCGPR